MSYPDEFLRELEDRNDIESVVRGYVQLTKRSGQNLYGLCPFHNEKTPSFSVCPSKQLYYCFGCGKGGGVINFIMEIENLSFPEAVEFLARRCGMTVPAVEYDPDRPRRERLLSALRDAARFYHEMLSSPSAQTARDYLVYRGLTPASVRKFGLGFAPDEWTALSKALTDKGYSERELEDAGLVKRGKSGVYDNFRMRLMFPVIDVRGNVIGFSGRALGSTEPKYLNTRDTKVFNKSQNLFGMNLAKKTKSGCIILVEGNIDVVSLHQAGFDSAVASLGTSLTGEQAQLLSRYTKEVVIAYDADGAGRKAAERAIALLDKLHLRVRVLELEDAKDPDEYLKAKGAAAFRNLLDASENHMEFRLSRITGQYDLKADDQKVLFLREATDLISTLPDAVEREVYSSRVASMAGVQPAVVAAEVQRLRNSKYKAAKKTEQRDLTKPLRSVQPRSGELRYSNPRSAAAETGVVRLMYLDPSLFNEQNIPREEDFSSAVLYKLFSLLRETAERGSAPSISVVGQNLSPDETSLLTDIIHRPEDLSNGARALNDYLKIMREENSSPADPAEALRALAAEMKKTKGYGAQS